MPLFSQDTGRIDPYKNFKFVVSWDNLAVAGVSKVSGLSRSTEAIEYREGGDPMGTRVSPGRTKVSPVTLERGVTHDQSFEWWANLVWFWSNEQQLLSKGDGTDMSLASFRKNLNLALFNEAGQKVLAYNLYRCWPSEFEALGDLDANGNGVVFQKLVLQCEGWERDVSVKEPKPATYGNVPAAG